MYSTAYVAPERVDQVLHPVVNASVVFILSFACSLLPPLFLFWFYFYNTTLSFRQVRTCNCRWFGTHYSTTAGCIIVMITGFLRAPLVHVLRVVELDHRVLARRQQNVARRRKPTAKHFLRRDTQRTADAVRNVPSAQRSRHPSPVYIHNYT